MAIKKRQLALISKARTALAEAKTLDDFKSIRNQGEAAIKYAKSCRDVGTDAIREAQEIVRRAERRMGEMLAEREKPPTHPPAKTVGNTLLPTTLLPTLGDLDITKMQSSRWQKEASVPEKVFDEWVEQAHENDEELSQAGLIQLSQSGEPHVARNTGQNEWYTPPEYIAAAIAVLGTIDCDPASSRQANKVVDAAQFFTAKQNGLIQTWGKRVYLNPPYAQPLCSQFCEAMAEKVKSGEVKSAIVLVNNATETAWFRMLIDCASAIIFPTGRVKFLDADGKPGAPLQGQAVIYIGKKPVDFLKKFTPFGWGASL